ncbi:MAG: type IV toxin-antitoxin system AbiEi family antitoxin domain-containing protein [Anaerolineales bacterium]|jgi:predicted transcriptional regulator of viral defense system|nr:type IV toxin-antitoxin system AbiEi family antitoxin domain-containing protein [Anaerolineales bacterium]
MDAKDKNTSLTIVRDILRRQHGILSTSDLAKVGVPRAYLSMLEKRGDIQRVSRGQYATADALVDEMANFQARYKAAIFSHETALYLHELTDRSPLYYSVTLPSGYNATNLKAQGAKVYFVNRKLYSLGLATVKSSHGNNLQAFGLERTVCDILRSRNQIDIQFISEAFKRYARREDKDIDILFRYAKQFRIEKIIRPYIELLL